MRVGLGVKEPFQIAQHASSVLLMRDHTLKTAFLFFGRFVVGQPVQETRLEFFNWGLFRHDASYWVNSMVLHSKSGYSPALVVNTRWPRPRKQSGAGSFQAVLRERRRASSV